MLTCTSPFLVILLNCVLSCRLSLCVSVWMVKFFNMFFPHSIVFAFAVMYGLSVWLSRSAVSVHPFVILTGIARSFSRGFVSVMFIVSFAVLCFRDCSWVVSLRIGR